MNPRLLVTVGALLAAFPSNGGVGASGGDTSQDVAALARVTEEANKALVRGDIDKYVALTRHSKDLHLLMNPFGGAPTRGFEDTPERRAGMKKFFKSGTLDQDVVATWESGDLAVLVTIERVHGEVGGMPEQDWALRVTQVFRRDGSRMAAPPPPRGSAREKDPGRAGGRARAGESAVSSRSHRGQS